jgi:hypothetical protein
MNPGTPDLTDRQATRGTGMQPLLSFICGHRGVHEGSSFRVIPGRAHARIPYKCAACTAEAKAAKEARA